ncbi:HAD-IA family hydrolase [Paenibacillus sp. VCA1]|uniref:HAD family hydrolase n=1 Tax=Paenibacillus sp. VCA1 TaxID=3039148 RepID=UPI00287141D6|nr:HAD-IA family hydrolase [Paenibacillus sp. VCA1]MDR9854698.1 HAD-IA family hydrolase [Paenibacillus sp. VCA1]
MIQAVLFDLDGIISNEFGRFQMNNVHGLGIGHYFDEILISETEGIRKPDAEIFQIALQRLGVKPHEAIRAANKIHKNDEDSKPLDTLHGAIGHPWSLKTDSLAGAVSFSFCTS